MTPPPLGRANGKPAGGPRPKGTGRRTLVAGNWKMNLNHLEAIALVQKVAYDLKPAELETVETVVFPPFVDLRSVQTTIDGDKLAVGYGAQDLSPFDSGAHTGDISGAMLAKLGCAYVIVGHSERRTDHHETDAVVAAKAAAAYKHGLTPIVCIGEHEDVRVAGTHIEHCLTQLAGSLAGITPKQAETIVVAYEPVWAIGTGRTASAQDAQDMCAAVRGKLAELFTPEIAAGIRVLYGGSVKASNAAELFTMPDVDGGLVGGASLVAEEFTAIVRSGPPA
ncbi:triose-phosphate isomerase [Frankia sp. CNm7]|uniref:Triosephosphate isomerase n=1 Tax=Frankia nepalensis TaxID=1836974 RepID=A0A937RKU7_9ACTN|nr:triose-phosphate isomerase [Frankia nepalensis]MBL7499955.1 triose-phosphate isomerase [Frankia nepalensis]MBL7515059.1 triose-phosphate isomerase [Frankia nepalensis]MBL7524725.1 triose-phosphate isomerase [Frankia nepalensis]MBL7632135.1 triose-phosphate isomerase [Frankia nepalensis]